MIYDTEKIAVVGIIEVIPDREILNANAAKYINETRPDIIILVDYVEFNLKVAKYAKSLGIKVVFTLHLNYGRGVKIERNISRKYKSSGCYFSI